MDIGINIGHTTESAQQATTVADAIVAILSASPDRETAVAALRAFENATSINNVTVSNNQLTSRQTDVWDVLDTDEDDEL